MRCQRVRPPGNRRTAFTLLEMLVVIAIIGVLAALTAAGVMGVIEGQHRSNTQTTLGKVGSALNKEWSAFKDRVRGETIPAQYYNTMYNMAGGDQGRLKVAWLKVRQRQIFPMNFQEALNPAPDLGQGFASPTYVSYLNQAGITYQYVTGPTYQMQPYESAACLLMALEQSHGGSGVNMEDIGGGGAIGNFQYPNAGMIRALIDDWGTPLQFSRLPIGNPELNQGANPQIPVGLSPAPSESFHDPADPEGLLTQQAWLMNNYQPKFNPAPIQLFANNVGYVPPQWNTTVNPPQPTSYRIIPLVASAGPDKLMGFDTSSIFSTLYMTPDGTGASNDNLYSPH